jgi:nitrate/nitrite transporter NarK
MGLIAVVAPAVVVTWFPPERRGLPMGIWATWVSLGSLIIYNAAPALNSFSDWQAVWWAGGLFALAAFVLYGLLVRPAPGAASRAERAAAFPWRALANRNIWLLAVSFASFNFVVIGVVATYFPTFLKTVRGMSLAEASLVTSLKMITVILAAPLAGWLSDRIGSPRKIILISLLGLAVFMCFPFTVTGIGIPASMVALGILAGSLPTATFAAAPAVMGDSRLGGLGMGVIMVGQNLGQLAGPVVFGALVKSAGWADAGLWSILALAIGFAALWFAKMR